MTYEIPARDTPLIPPGPSAFRIAECPPEEFPAGTEYGPLEAAGIPVAFRVVFRAADYPRNAFRGFRGAAG